MKPLTRKVGSVALLLAAGLGGGLVLGSARAQSQPVPVPAPPPAPKPAANPGPFADVPLTHPAYATIEHFRKESGLFTGYPDGTFSGRRALTRYEFAVSVQRMTAELERVTAATVRPEPLRAGPGGIGGAGAAYEGKLRDYLAEPRRVRAVAGWMTALALEFDTELEMLGQDRAKLWKRLERLRDEAPAIAAQLKKKDAR